MAVMRALLSGLLALHVAVSAEESPLFGAPMPLEQKWSWADLDALKEALQESVDEHTQKLKDQVNEQKDKIKDKLKEHTDKLADARDQLNEQKDKIKDKLKEHTDKLTDGIDSYKQAVKNYADAVKDTSFTKAVEATGICKHLLKLEEESGPEIEEQMPEPLTDMEQDPGEVPEACAAAADEVTAEELKKQLKEVLAGETVDKFMKTIIDRSSASLCEGKSGIKDWLKENSGLRETSPEEYKQELKKKLHGKVGPILNKYTSELCPGSAGEEEEEERLFALGSGPLAKAVARRGAAVPSLLAAAAAALLSLGVLALRRAARRLPAEELEPLASEDAAEQGLEC